MDVDQSGYDLGTLSVYYKIQSKTDPFRQGTDIYLSITDNSICPIAGLIPYLTIRGAQPGPLFMTSNHRYLTRALFSQKLNELLSLLHIDTRHYNTHSFWIGAATTAAKHISPTPTSRCLEGGEVRPTSAILRHLHRNLQISQGA